MNFSTLTVLQRRGLTYIIIGVLLRIILSAVPFGDLALMVVLFGVIHLGIDVYERRYDLAADHIEEETNFQTFLEEDPVRRDMSPDDARAAYIAWRDTRHYGS